MHDRMTLSRRSLLIAGGAGLAAGSLGATLARPARAAQQRWIAGTAVPPTDFIALATDDFAERVGKLTDGSIEIQTHHGGALGGDRDLVESVKQGAIQIAVPGQALLAGWYKPAEVWIFPYLFKNTAHKNRVWDAVRSEYGDAVAGDAGLRPMVSVPRAPRQLSANKVVRTPDDTAGLKIRVPETPMWQRTFERFGASPTPMPFPDVYQALKSGVIDGQDNPVPLTWNSGFFEVNTHLNLTEHMMQDNVIVLGEAVYSQLTPEQQEAVQQAARETEKKFRAQLDETHAELLQKVREKGIVVTEVDKDAFRASVAGLEEEFPHVREWVERARAVD